MSNTNEESLKYRVYEVDTALESLELLTNIVSFAPQGVLYTESLASFNENFEVVLKNLIREREFISVNDNLLLDSSKLSLINKPGFRNWYNGLKPSVSIDNVYDLWVDGPSLEILEEIYSEYPDFASTYMNDYLVWRVHYEVNLKYYEDINNIFGELSDSEKKGLQEFEDYYSTTHVETTDSSSSSTIIGDTNDNGSSDGDLTKTDDDENDSDPLSGDIIEQFPDIKNETNMPPKSRLTFWGHNHMLMFLSVDSRNSGDSFLENVENYSCGVERSENRHAVLYRAAAYRNAVVIVNS